jgi:hypothetical protein
LRVAVHRRAAFARSEYIPHLRFGLFRVFFGAFCGFPVAAWRALLGKMGHFYTQRAHQGRGHGTFCPPACPVTDRHVLPTIWVVGSTVLDITNRGSGHYDTHMERPLCAVGEGRIRMGATAFAGCLHPDSSACQEQHVLFEKACVGFASVVGVLRSARVRRMPFLPPVIIAMQPCAGIGLPPRTAASFDRQQRVPWREPCGRFPATPFSGHLSLPHGFSLPYP